MTLDNQVTGNAGLYWACYQLSRLGWNVMPTSRNAQGVDIIAYNRACTQKVAIQVKTLSRRNPVPLGTAVSNLVGDFWIIVSEIAVKPCAYVLLPKEVEQLAHRGEKEGRVSYWLQPAAYAAEEFHEAWARIGDPHKPGKAQTPIGRT